MFFNIDESLLELHEVLIGLQIRIAFGESKDGFQSTGDHIFGLTLFLESFGVHSHVSCLNHFFQSAGFVRGVAFYCFDEIWQEVIAAFELGIDIGPGFGNLVFEFDEAVV